MAGFLARIPSERLLSGFRAANGIEARKVMMLTVAGLLRSFT